MTIEQIINTRIIPIFSNVDPELCLQVVETCYQAGLRAFEFTNRTQNSLEVFSYLIQEKKSKMPDLALGIGTVFNQSMAESFLKAEADFVVSPIYDQGVMDTCKEVGIHYIPGVFSPAEIYSAYKCGADLVKVFPGDGVSPEYIKALKGPMPFLKIMVTGGVNADKSSIDLWIKSGANCVGLGSKLIDNKVIESKNFSDLKSKIISCLN